jgi:hypothetical protein
MTDDDPELSDAEKARIERQRTFKRVRELLDYDPETGVFRWKMNRTNGVKAGDVAGVVNASHGYVIVCIENRRYRGHRLAWFYTHGEWPTFDLDHADADRTNNALSNLRPCNDALNVANARRRKDNTSGFKGVSWHKTKKRWFAHIRVDGVLRHLGGFSDPAAAHDAYAAAALKHYGEFARV